MMAKKQQHATPREAVLDPVPPIAREWPTIGNTIFYSLIKSNRRQGTEDFWISRRWRDSNCHTGPTDAEVQKLATKWGYTVTIDELDGYHFISTEGTLDGSNRH